MDPLKDTRWRQRFENYEKSYKLLEKYTKQELKSEIEKAGIIQFFEMTFELAWKVLKDYLEAQGFIVKSPRDTVKQAFQIGLIEEGHIWMDALSKRNLTTHTYDEAFAEKFVGEIKQLYFPIFKSLYDKLSEE
ncbi:nucleotidyltransferase substrate binding protein [Cytobacillus sp. S13-E01]|uniref:nucleotidyltransferase substrate binding protein n=1 Tax=Cytobacillus sp. S13-E01 TaxID=3031326 RepID=UPI0023D8783D|nr:nucleotidyltransferase substrate binding protein [Cytobacillus sp. S13-E01]MDF0728953.1 nucleotidyltransferase substrate binding protein [Cytobacillus sp. S13-E01]